MFRQNPLQRSAHPSPFRSSPLLRSVGRDQVGTPKGGSYQATAGELVSPFRSSLSAPPVWGFYRTGGAESEDLKGETSLVRTPFGKRPHRGLQPETPLVKGALPLSPERPQVLPCAKTSFAWRYAEGVFGKRGSALSFFYLVRSPFGKRPHRGLQPETPKGFLVKGASLR